VGITVLKHNVPWGPFTREQIQQGLARGDFTLQYLAHAPGLTEWLPLGEVLHILDANLPPVRPSNDLPPVPGVESLAAIGTKQPSAAPPAAPPIIVESVAEPLPLPVMEKPAALLPPAPFFPRFIAFLIDCAILFLPILALFALGYLSLEVRGWWQQIDSESMTQERALLWRNFLQLLALAAFGFGWLYAAGLECSRWQATVGKQWMGMKVTDLQGERLGFLRATGRHAAKYLSALPCFLGFMAALFNSRRMAMHDWLAGTRVVRR
jgi:uncharacterized RDD family membrane protein YckC